MSPPLLRYGFLVLRGGVPVLWDGVSPCECCGIEECGCPGLKMPRVFNGTLTAKSGFCVTFPDSCLFTYDPDDHSWRLSEVWGEDECYYAVKLLANPSSDPPYASCGWVFDDQFGPNRFASFPVASQNCDPLIFTLTVTALSDGAGPCNVIYGMSGAFTLTLTPA